MSKSLWPDLSTLSPSRGMREMLDKLAGDIDDKTSGAIQFHVDLLGVSRSPTAKELRFNCYLRVPKRDYNHLFFQVSTPMPGPWPATVKTPEGEKSYANLSDESALRDAIQEILRRDRTKDILEHLLNIAGWGRTDPVHPAP